MENTDITIADLIIIKDIIDLSAGRGAFRGSELKTVGEVYDKLTSFIDAFNDQVGEEIGDSEESPTN
jgi:hypothetical protein